MNDRQKKKKRKYIESFDTVDALAANTNLDKRLIDGQIIRTCRAIFIWVPQELYMDPATIFISFRLRHGNILKV